MENNQKQNHTENGTNTEQKSDAISPMFWEDFDKVETKTVLEKTKTSTASMEKTKNIPYILETPQVLGVTELGAYAVTIRIVAKCQVKQNWTVERELRLRIKNRLDKENIIIPFPQATVHIQKEQKE